MKRDIWEAVEYTEVWFKGECHRYPPQLHTPLNAKRLEEESGIGWMLGSFPETDSAQWCGEFKEMTTEQQEQRTKELHRIRTDPSGTLSSEHRPDSCLYCKWFKPTEDESA